MHRLQRITVSLIALLPAITSAQEPLGNLGENRLPQLEQVQVSGVVTFFEPAWHNLVIQDGDQAVRVGLRSGIELPDSLAVGDIVRIDGRRQSLDELRHVDADKVSRTGPSELPKPVSLSSNDALSLKNEDRLVECEGVVFRSDTDGSYGYFSIATPQCALKLYASLSDGEVHDATEWLGRRVRVHGVLRFPPDEECAARILTAMTLLQRVPSPNTRLTDGAGFQLIGTIRESSHDAAVPLNIIGQAISDSQSPEVIVQDSTGSIRVESSQLPEIQVGDIVIATGSIQKNGNRLPVLSGDVVRVGSGQSLVAERVPTDKVVKHPYQYLKTTGTLSGFLIREDQRVPILTNNETAFKVRASDALLARFNQLPGGTQLSVTGVCRPRKGNNFQFEFLATDINVLYFPVDYRADSANNPGDPQTTSVSGSASRPASAVRTSGGLPLLSGLRPESLLIVASVALLLMLGVLIAFLILLRRTQERRKFYATIHEQLNEVSHVSRLNTLAEMVEALAHEVNQPLASVTNFAETARIMATQLDSPSPKLEKLLERVASESLRAGKIIRRLRSLASRKTPGQVSTPLNQVVDDSLDMFRLQELVTNGTVETHLQEDLPPIDVDPIQLQQVILNLLLNARDATTQLEERLPKITVRTERCDDWLTVSVEDNGPGIAGNDPSTVFEPYFTTKPEGMGLGLAICRTIVESHNGKLNAENLKPHGARLSVSLPLYAPEGLSVTSESAA